METLKVHRRLLELHRELDGWRDELDTMLFELREARLHLGTKLVQELLGHSQIAMTLDVYSSVVPTMHDRIATTMEQLLSMPRTAVVEGS